MAGDPLEWVAGRHSADDFVSGIWIPDKIAKKRKSRSSPKNIAKKKRLYWRDILESQTRYSGKTHKNDLELRASEMAPNSESETAYFQIAYFQTRIKSALHHFHHFCKLQ